MAVDLPRANASIDGGVTVAGWALDLGASSGTGVDAVDVWAYPASGAAAVFVGSASLGVSRPDVGAAFANGRYSSAGFVVTGSLAPGAYNLAVFARSTVAGTFNNTTLIAIQVLAPRSVPRMAVDLPAQHQYVSGNFTVAGWAIDVGASAGTGVDAVHVWAYPVGGGSPVFVGVAWIGVARPDVAGAFGQGRFTSSGFSLSVTGAVPRGTFDLVIYAHSSVTGTFNNAATVRVTVL